MAASRAAAAAVEPPLGALPPSDLLGQRPAAAQEHRTRGSLEQGTILGRHEIGAQHEHAPVRCVPLMPRP